MIIRKEKDFGYSSVLHKIRFKGKRSIDWKEVREYLREYVGTSFERWKIIFV